MIIGNPLTLGGGNLLSTDAILRVQAPAGSTVTITKGTTTKTDEGHENADDNTVYDYYFIIHTSQFDSVNPWTVTASLGTKTATESIIIDAADEYDISIIYKLFLVKDGVLVTDAFVSSNGSVSQESGYVNFASSGNIGFMAYLQTQMQDYSSVVLEVYDNNGRCYRLSSNSPSFGVASSVPSVNASNGAISGYTAYKKLPLIDTDHIAAGTYALDISEYASSANYIAIGVCGISEFSGSIRVSNFYLSP